MFLDKVNIMRLNFLFLHKQTFCQHTQAQIAKKSGTWLCTPQPHIQSHYNLSCKNALAASKCLTNLKTFQDFHNLLINFCIFSLVDCVSYITLYLEHFNINSILILKKIIKSD